MFGTEMEIGGADCSDSPISLAVESCRLVLSSGSHNDLLSVNVCRLRGSCSHLRLFPSLCLDFSHLLALQGWWGNLHTQDNVPNLTLCQTGNIDVIFLAVIGEDQVLQGNFNLDPLLVGKSRPNVMRLCHHAVVWTKNNLHLVRIYVQSTKNQDQPRESSVGRNCFQPIVEDIEQNHLRLRSSKNKVAEFLNLESCLEWKL
mmetsp:Transcript_5921/g.12959  ORF Transcript_5921/g.12959 Transcript_5921/m.12959 type:complete len:201 (+) Transcript_5921:986-1588(+)